MAYGDVGGAVTELIITCKTKEEGKINIEKGDPVCLVGDYTISNDGENQILFGQAMMDSTSNGVAIPVKVRGIAIFELKDSIVPKLDGGDKCFISTKNPKLLITTRGIGSGTIVQENQETKEVHVLI